MTRSDEDPLGCRAQRAPKAVDFRTTYRVPPPLYLSLHVSSREELVSFIYIGINVYSAISGGLGYRNLHESASLQNKLNEVLEIIWSELKETHSHGLDL